MSAPFTCIYVLTEGDGSENGNFGRKSRKEDEHPPANTCRGSVKSADSFEIKAFSELNTEQRTCSLAESVTVGRDKTTVFTRLDGTRMAAQECKDPKTD